MAVALERATRCVMSLSQSRESGRPPDEASGNTGGQADSKPPEAGSARHDLHAPWNATVERPVIPAWKRQRNTGDLRRNATSWLARPRPSGIVRSWRKWRRPGRGSPRRPTDKALTPRSERVLPWRVRASPPCQAEPYLRHMQQGGPRFRVMERARHLQALGGVASILVESPHRVPCADLAQRGSALTFPSPAGPLRDFHAP
jgi:hypothetical protein